MNVKGYIENGQWKALCIVCGTACTADPVSNTIICYTCYPTLKAMAMKPLAGGLLRPVPDIALRTEARAQALLDNAIYTLEFPAEREQIESLLRARPSRANMNWYYEDHPTLLRMGKRIETVEDLLAENINHGVV